MSNQALARRAFFLKQFDASISHELVIRALDKLADMRDASFYFQKGEEHRLKNEVSLAVSYYERALKIDPEHENSLFYIGLCYLGFSYELTGEHADDDLMLAKQERLNRSIFYYKRLINIKEDRDEKSIALCIDYFNLSIAFHRLGKYNSALDTLYHAIRVHSDYAPAYDMLALVKSDMTLNKEALKDCLHALELQKDPTFFDTLGIIQMRSGLIENAIESFEIAMDGMPRYIFPYIHLNYLYRKQKKFNDAFEVLDKALSVNPNYPGFYYYYAITEDEYFDKAGAAKYYRDFLKRVPGTSTCYKKQINHAKKRLQELQKPLT